MRVSRNVEWGELLGMQKIETMEQMPDEYRDVLLKLIYALASTEFASVEQHQPWINRGPTPEDRYIQAQIAADEAHQGFIDCLMLRNFGPDGAEITVFESGAILIFLAEKTLNLRVFPDGEGKICLLYTSPSPRDATLSRMPSSA